MGLFMFESIAQKDLVFFVAGQAQLNKAHVQYLESQLIKLAIAAKRVLLENGNTPTEPTLSEADRADMDVFLSNILGMLPVLGVHAFEKSSPKADGGRPQLKCQGKGIVATGLDTAQGFIVRVGSYACKDITPSLNEYFPSTCELRAQLLTNGVLAAKFSVLQSMGAQKAP